MAAAPIPWSSANSPIDWDAIGINWNTAAKANTGLYGVLSDQAVISENSLSPQISFGALADQSNTGILSTEETIAFGSLGGFSSSGGMDVEGSISIGALADQSAAGLIAGEGSITFGSLADYVNAVNHAESVSIGTLADWSSADAFLWNEVGSVTTTWTKVE